MKLSRRQFLLGTTAAIAATALPKLASAERIVGIDIGGPDRTAIWIMESTPGLEDSFFRALYMNTFEARWPVRSAIGVLEGIKIYEAEHKLSCEELYDRLKADLKGKETPWTFCHPSSSS